MNRFSSLAIVFSLALAGCGSKSPPSETMVRASESMDACVSYIVSDLRKKWPNEQLEIITDKAGHVSGLSTPNRMHWACRIERTETRGTYIRTVWSSPL